MLQASPKTNKVFSAGFDLEALAGDKAAAYLAEYFKLAELVSARFENHHIALIDGHAALGTFGVSAAGRWSVATEAASLAVDEVRAGLPVTGGASYVLARMPFGMGAYMGLTGRRLNGRSLLHAGLATHYLGSDKLPALLDELATLTTDAASYERINDVLTFFIDNLEGNAAWLELEKSPEGLAHRRAALDKTLSGRDGGEPSGALEWTFGEAPSMEMLVERLSVLNSPWGARMLASLAFCSPLALKVSFELIRSAADKTLHEAMRDEYRAAVRLIKSPDFAVGRESYARVAALGSLNPASGSVPAKLEPPSWPSGSVADVADADVTAIINTPLSRGADGASDLVFKA